MLLVLHQFFLHMSIYFAYLHDQEGHKAMLWTVCFVCNQYYDESVTNVINKHSFMDMIVFETSTCSDLFILRSEFDGVLRCVIQWKAFIRRICKMEHSEAHMNELWQSHVYQSLSRSNGSQDKFMMKGSNLRWMRYLKKECKILVHG
jgi:hypothetical protein